MFEAILTSYEAEKILDYYFGYLIVEDLPVHEMLGFSIKEWSAYALGVPFEVIAKWRADGWPDVCFFCKKEIISDSYGWFPYVHDGKYELTHLVCTKPID
ncbi:hypothetical protein [Mycoavidus sp. B2-EB]|uniref:hypothetical protein n=1 Tax=Mycoavidus sp. B2-EB TaxID=2651972 RepID=UPI001624153E|nr:hypothetical protein [Mycoavidus sp. B2-EB]BBO59025.1 hypothetical protein MPB2EB_0126 [Mycoavidus sp. B2-EB]